MKVSNDPTGNPNRDLSACSAVQQPNITAKPFEGNGIHSYHCALKG